MVSNRDKMNNNMSAIMAVIVWLFGAICRPFSRKLVNCRVSIKLIMGQQASGICNSMCGGDDELQQQDMEAKISDQSALQTDIKLKTAFVKDIDNKMSQNL